MTETDPPTSNTTKDLKLYSTKAIGGATFLGGPLAAGYMIGENFKALEQPQAAKKSLWIGVLSTVILFGGIFMLPKAIVDRIPRQLIPLVYTAIIWGLVEWKQGQVLKDHQFFGNVFYSGWRAAGIGLLSLLCLAVFAFGYVFLLESDDPAYAEYDTKMAVYGKNEEESLAVFEGIEQKSNARIITELDLTSIPRWKENIALLKDLNSLEGMPSELLERNSIILAYSELRLQQCHLIKKIVSEDTNRYDHELELLNQRINTEVEKLNRIP
ncbi:MAG: hypothetical protein HRT65_00875 [Flavobacteriaceae bacterium]|nr:hypothetical protein [Flavobacteriaceae bacterium]